MNVFAAIAAALLLGSSAGWLAPGRGNAGVLLGDILPFFQFIAFAAFVDHAMSALASRDPGA